MKTSTTLTALIAMAGMASAQGLLSIAPETSAPTDLPLAFSVNVTGGYDSNTNSTGIDPNESFFLSSSLGTEYAYVTDRTTMTFGASAGVLYYFDQIPFYDDTLYNFRLTNNIVHALSDRLSVSNQLYFGYEFEPNFAFGESLNRSSEQYFFVYDTISFDYLWTDRFSTATGYSIRGTFYDRDTISNREDRLSHTFNQLFRYAVSDRLGARAEYRFNYTDYDFGTDSTSHFALAGIDYAFSENTVLLLMAGAEFYDYSDTSGNNTKPYVEAGISHQASDNLSIRWANRLGFEAANVVAYGENYTFRSDLSVRYQLSEKLSSYGGLTYAYSDYQQNLFEESTQDVMASVGLGYAFTEMFSINANYSYTMSDSDIATNDYDRHRVSVGVTATF